MARARTHIRIDACLRCESLSSTLPIQLLSSPPPAWLFGPITHRRASLFLMKLLWNVGKADAEEVGVKRSLYRQSKILHCFVYSALWLGGLRCQYRRQTNGPLTAHCPCVMVLGKKKKKIKIKRKSVGSFSASAHRKNALLPIQPWFSHKSSEREMITQSYREIQIAC